MITTYGMLQIKDCSPVFEIKHLYLKQNMQFLKCKMLFENKFALFEMENIAFEN